MACLSAFTFRAGKAAARVPETLGYDPGDLPLKG
jgi:hypothetical protein